MSHRYVRALYLGLAQLVGENVEPGTNLESVFAMVLILLGACLNASLFGQVAFLIQNTNSPSNRLQSVMDSVNENMRTLKVRESRRVESEVALGTHNTTL